MKKTIEQYLDELLTNIKEEYTPIKEILKKETEDVSCNFIARTTGVVSGVKIAQYIFKKTNSKIGFKILKDDGNYVNRGDVVCVMSGPINEILKVSNLALNFVRYMSGIATLVSKYKMEISDLETQLLYSGHSAPGLESFAELAFIDGGGVLYEENKNYCVLSSNTIARFESIDLAIKAIKEVDKSIKPIVEVNDQIEFEEALFSNALVIRLNSSKESIIKNCSIINNDKKILELQSEIELRHIRQVAKMGYKYIIIPSLSDAAKSLPIDLSFYKRFKKVK
jgi:nicotinate-nucleotide pyrophosphorylase (carboxylating)